MSTFILGGICGLLLGLAICYGRQIMAVYQNKDKISAVSNLATSLGQVGDAFGIKL